MKDKLIDALKEFAAEQKDPWAILQEFSVGEQDYVEEYCECVCGKQHIKRITYITHKATGKELVIGSECIGRFGLTGLCNRCHETPVEKSSYNMCIACRRTGKKVRWLKKVKCGKYKGQTYQYVYEEQESYCDWVLETYTFPDSEFRDYLKDEYLRTEGKPYILKDGPMSCR